MFPLYSTNINAIAVVRAASALQIIKNETLQISAIS